MLKNEVLVFEKLIDEYGFDSIVPRCFFYLSKKEYEYTFTKIKEYTKASDHKIRNAIKVLKEMEYIIQVDNYESNINKVYYLLREDLKVRKAFEKPKALIKKSDLTEEEIELFSEYCRGISDKTGKKYEWPMEDFVPEIKSLIKGIKKTRSGKYPLLESAYRTGRVVVSYYEKMGDKAKINIGSLKAHANNLNNVVYTIRNS